MENKIPDKIIIYQLFPRLFGNGNTNCVPWGTIDENGCGKFNDIDDKALSSINSFGISHIWLTGVIRHATGTAYKDPNLQASHPQILKGLAGSPYAIKDYYDVDPDLAVRVDKRMEEFENLVSRIHKYGFKILLDFVPNHVSRDYRSIKKPAHLKDLGENDDSSVSFAPENNFYYLPGEKLQLPIPAEGEPYSEYPARATGNDRFSPAPSVNDWFETIKLNYGLKYPEKSSHFDPVPDTWIKMLEILRFWCSKGIDGFRCDMAGMVPLEFWNFATGNIRDEFPGTLFIAELYEPQLYRSFIEKGGFDYLYDKVGLYDCLHDIILSRKTTESITGIWQNMGGLDPFLLRFMENHDEQRIASKQFAGDPWAGLPAMAVCTLMERGPLLLYNGQETGEDASGLQGFSSDDGRTSIFDYCAMTQFQKWRNKGRFDGKELDEDKKELLESYKELLKFASTQPEVRGHFYDLMWQNQDIAAGVRSKIFAFLRYINNSAMLIAVRFSREIEKIKIRVPVHALELAGMENRERFQLETIYPYQNRQVSIMSSQLSRIGTEIQFDRSGWAAVRIY